MLGFCSLCQALQFMVYVSNRTGSDQSVFQSQPRQNAPNPVPSRPFRLHHSGALPTFHRRRAGAGPCTACGDRAAGGLAAHGGGTRSDGHAVAAIASLTARGSPAILPIFASVCAPTKRHICRCEAQERCRWI